MCQNMNVDNLFKLISTHALSPVWNYQAPIQLFQVYQWTGGGCLVAPLWNKHTNKFTNEHGIG